LKLEKDDRLSGHLLPPIRISPDGAESVSSACDLPWVGGSSGKVGTYLEPFMLAVKIGGEHRPKHANKFLMGVIKFKQ
jgi:hypothetical protein